MILHGDNRELIAEMESGSVDAIVTDPPYGLGKEPDAVQMLLDWVQSGHHEVRGKGFMGKEWDAFVPQPQFWAECFRVLKPGAYLVTFGGTRTFDLISLGLRLAGFEYRDTIMWVYGCLSDDTEVLTQNGWERYDKSNTSSIFAKEILIYDVETDTYKWEVPSRWQHYHVKDTAYRIQSDSTDQIVSRNHRCLVERGGELVFRSAETLFTEESVPFLEGVPKLPSGISYAHKRAGDQKQGLWENLCRRIDGGGERENNATTSAKGEVCTMCRLSDGSLEARRMAPKGESANMQQQVQWQVEGLGVSEAQPQREIRMEQKRGGSAKRPNDRGVQPVMERRGDVLQAKGQVCEPSNQVCEMPSRYDEYGSQGRICDGAPAKCCSCNRETIGPDRVCASYQSRRNRQSLGELDAVCDECGPQAVRARPTYQTTLAAVTSFEYEGLIFCPTVSTGAFVARRNGKVFLTGNSGFPKSHDISKAMDKHLGVEREVLSMLPAGHGPLKTGHVNVSGGGMSIGTDRSPEIKVTEPSSDEAKEWAGWGTALKPAYEPILIFRKPLEGTVVQNILKWGVGGIDIDGSRIGSEEMASGGSLPDIRANNYENSRGKARLSTPVIKKSGRFPANFIHDGSEEVLEGFPQTRPGKSDGFKGEYTGKTLGQFTESQINPETVYGDQGSAARFFYCAKATQSERKGSKHPTIKPKALIDYLVRMVSKEGHTILDPFGGSGTTYEVCLESRRQCVIMERDEESIKDIKARINGVQTRII